MADFFNENFMNLVCPVLKTEHCLLVTCERLQIISNESMAKIKVKSLFTSTSSHVHGHNYKVTR